MHLASRFKKKKYPFKSLVLQFFITIYDYINSGRHPHYSDLSKESNSLFMHEANLEL